MRIHQLKLAIILVMMGSVLITFMYIKQAQAEAAANLATQEIEIYKLHCYTTEDIFWKDDPYVRRA